MDGSRSRSLAVPRLPDDVLEQIISRLRAKSLCRCKCVSKPWRDLIADRLGCKDLPKTLQGFLYLDAASGGAGSGDGGDGGGDGDGDGDGGGDGDADADADADGSNDGDADADGGDVVSGHNEMLLRHGHGLFINLLGEPVSLLDPTFAFMKERPGIQAIELLDSCNGLLLFGHRRVSDTYHSLGYIVCNPVTEQWVAVPFSGWAPTPPEETNENEEEGVDTFLLFDPSVSSHFDLVQFWQHGMCVLDEVECVHTYSSVTGLWSDRTSEWRGQGGGWMKWGRYVELESSGRGRALVNGMMHILTHNMLADEFQIVAVDCQGRTCRVIKWPDHRTTYPFVGFIGQSQGRLHCISTWVDWKTAYISAWVDWKTATFSEGGDSESYGELSVWVLEDYNTEEWVLKHSLSLIHLVEGVHPRCLAERLRNYGFIGFDISGNMMFFVDYQDRKLISYDMDSREVHVLCTLAPGHGNPCVTQYVPSLQSL